MRRANLDVSFILEESATATCFTVAGRVLIYLLTHHNLRHGAYPGRRRISRDLNIAERSVQRALLDLEAADLIRRHGSVKGKARYYLPVNDQGYMHGGPDKWQYIEGQTDAPVRQDVEDKVTHSRPEGDAFSSGSGRNPVRQGDALSSSPPDAPARQIHSGDEDEKTSEHSMNTLKHSGNTPKPGVCIHAPGEPETPADLQRIMDENNRKAAEALTPEQQKAHEQMRREKGRREPAFPVDNIDETDSKDSDPWKF